LSGSALNRGALRRRTLALTTPRGLFLATALLLCVLPVTSAIRDPDFWWHLRTGELILDRHGLIDTDPFTYTVASHHWTMHEWLTEVLFAGLYRSGGLAMVVAFLAAVTWLGVLLIFLRARLRAPHHIALGIGLVLAVIVGYPIWGPRAQMITFALCCLLLYLVDRHLRVGGRAIWLLVPIFVVWSNLHSGFIIGAGFLTLIIAAEVIGRWIGWPQAASPERVWTLLRVLLACMAVVVINPNGPSIYLYPFETQGSAAQQSLILEWHSPDFHDASVWGFEFMMLSLAVMVVITRRVSARDAVLALVTTALALQSARHIALFVAAATPLWIEQFDMVSRQIAARRRLTAVGSRRRQEPKATSAPASPPVLARAVSYSVLTVLAVVDLLWVAGATTVREDSLFYARDIPVCAARWLQTAPSGLRIFNQYGEGGYLALRLQPHGDRVFIFGDAALMGDQLLGQYGDVEQVQPRFERVLHESGTDLIVFDSGASLVNVLVQSPRWIEVYRDPLTVAFVPATDPGRELLHRLPAPPTFDASSNDPCAQLQRRGLKGT
jgi:hypothetical protein